MSTFPTNPQTPEPLVGFAGDVGGARRGEETIFRASDEALGADFYLGMLARGSALLVLAMLVSLIIVLFQNSISSMREYGPAFLVNTEWRPNMTTTPSHPKLDAEGKVVVEHDDLSGEDKIIMEAGKDIPPSFGAAAMIFGTAVSSLLALLIAVPLSFGSSLFLVRIGAWLSPTFIKSGMAGICLTVVLAASLGLHSGALGILGLCAGLALTGLVLWIAWRTEDPRIGPRRDIEFPMYGIIALSMFILCAWVIGLSYLGAAVSALVVTVGVHLLASSFVGIVSFLIEFLAAIPSIAYGIWGVLILLAISSKERRARVERLLQEGRHLFVGSDKSFLSTADSLSGHDMLVRRHDRRDHDPSDHHRDQPGRASRRSPDSDRRYAGPWRNLVAKRLGNASIWP